YVCCGFLIWMCLSDRFQNRYFCVLATALSRYAIFGIVRRIYRGVLVTRYFLPWLLCTTKFEPSFSRNATDFARAARVVALYSRVRSDRVVIPTHAVSASAITPALRPR